MTPPEDVVRRFHAAFATLDREQIRPFLADEVEFCDPRTRVHGPDAVLDAFAPVFERFDSFDPRLVAVASDGPVVLVERNDVVVVGGAEAEVPAVALLEVSGEQLVRWYDYFDADQVAGLMGVSPSPSPSPSPAPAPGGGVRASAREVLYTTRAMRRLRPDPLPDDVLARIVDAGIRAPHPGPAQSWRFLVVTDRTVVARLGDLWRSTRDELLRQMPNLYHDAAQASSSQFLHDHFDEVPALVFGYGPSGLGSLSVVQALWSMCLAARAEGVGSTFTTLFARAADRVNEILGVPADAGLELFGTLPLGRPRGRWGVAPRQPVTEVAFVDQWGRAPTWSGVAPPA